MIDHQGHRHRHQHCHRHRHRPLQKRPIKNGAEIKKRNRLVSQGILPHPSLFHIDFPTWLQKPEIPSLLTTLPVAHLEKKRKKLEIKYPG